MLELLKKCFTWQGRLDRADFCAGMLGLGIPGLAFMWAIQADMFLNKSRGIVDVLGFAGLFFILWLLVFFIQLSLFIRRFHDLGRPGVYVLFFLVPFANFYFLFLLFFGKTKEDPPKIMSGRRK
jgi:uncharacterized membrane protein YhaH (DUF805 family)